MKNIPIDFLHIGQQKGYIQLLEEGKRISLRHP